MMSELFQASSHWIDALGKTLLHSLWISSIFYSLLRFALIIVPPSMANFRYRIATGTLILSAAMLVALFALLHAPSAGEMQRISSWPPGVSDPGGDIPGMTGSDANLICMIAAAAYITGVAWMLVRSAGSLLFLSRVKRRSTPVDGPWLHRFLAMKERLGITKGIRLLSSAEMGMPVTAGFFKPVVIVPAAMLTHLPVAQVETLMLHELYHLRRHDYLLNLFQVVIESICFYNPFVWQISKTIRIEREHCCDDGVVHTTDRRLEYARALHHLAGSAKAGYMLFPGASGGGRGNLLYRINRILHTETMKKNRKEKIESALLLAGGIAMFGIITFLSTGGSTVENLERAGESAAARFPSAGPSGSTVVSDTLPGTQAQDQGEEGDNSGDRPLGFRDDLDREIREALEEIDLEALEQEMEAARKEMGSSLRDLDVEEIRREVEKCLENMEPVDWEKIRRELERSRATIEAIDPRVILREVERNLQNLDLPDTGNLPGNPSIDPGISPENSSPEVAV